MDRGEGAWCDDGGRVIEPIATKTYQNERINITEKEHGQSKYLRGYGKVETFTV